MNMDKVADFVVYFMGTSVVITAVILAVIRWLDKKEKEEQEG